MSISVTNGQSFFWEGLQTADEFFWIWDIFYGLSFQNFRLDSTFTCYLWQNTMMLMQRSGSSLIKIAKHVIFRSISHSWHTSFPFLTSIYLSTFILLWCPGHLYLCPIDFILRIIWMWVPWEQGSLFYSVINTKYIIQFLEHSWWSINICWRKAGKIEGWKEEMRNGKSFIILLVTFLRVPVVSL